MSKKYKKVKINNMLNARVEFFTYQNRRKGFRLLDEDGNYLMRCTINIDNLEVKENEVLIKDYAENKGIYKALLRIGFINHYHKRISIGYDYALACNLNKDYEYEN